MAEGRKTMYIATKFGPRRERRLEDGLLALAERQHGVVKLAQLRALGLSLPGVRARVAAGRLHRVHAGVYAVGRPDLPIEGRWMAAVLACGRGAALSHRTAAAAHGLLTSAQTRIDVTVTRRVGLSRRGICVHRPTSLSAADLASARGIPCTSISRTLLDLASVLPRPALERACDQAELLRLLDMAAMDELLARSSGRRGVRVLRAVLAAGELGKNIPRSELETRFLALCRAAGVPAPAVNTWITVAGEEMQVDFVWQAQRLVVETDGFRTHRTRKRSSAIAGGTSCSRLTAGVTPGSPGTRSRRSACMSLACCEISTPAPPGTAGPLRDRGHLATYLAEGRKTMHIATKFGPRRGCAGVTSSSTPPRGRGRPSRG
jgi:Transcriptional regulator, AbiEi antitoxin